MSFLNGALLRPLPPVESKQQDVRYFHIHEYDQLDKELAASWVKQASELPGETLFYDTGRPACEPETALGRGHRTQLREPFADGDLSNRRAVA